MEYYLSNSKERHWVIVSNVDGPRVCQTVKSVRKRKPNIAYSHIYRGSRNTEQVTLFAGQE